MRYRQIGCMAVLSLLAGCDAAPKPATPAASQAPATVSELPNLRGALRLTKAQRDGHIKDCRNSGVMRLNTRVINAVVIAAAREQ
jgi:hypothetical protein